MSTTIRPRATCGEVALRAGVSRTTVSFVLNDLRNKGISETTRQKVLDAASDLGYQPNAAARTLAGGSTGTIAVVIGFSTEIAEITDWRWKIAAILITLAAIGGTMLVVWLSLKLSAKIAERIGPSALDVLTRLMGFLLICIGVQFVGSGIRTFYSTLS